MYFNRHSRWCWFLVSVIIYLAFFVGSGHSSELGIPQKVIDDLLYFVSHDDISHQHSQISKELEQWWDEFQTKDPRITLEVINIILKVDDLRAKHILREKLIADVHQLKQMSFFLPEDEKYLLLSHIANRNICDPTTEGALIYIRDVNSFMEKKEGAVSIIFKQITYAISEIWDENIDYTEFQILITKLTKNQLITTDRLPQEMIEYKKEKEKFDKQISSKPKEPNSFVPTAEEDTFDIISQLLYLTEEELQMKFFHKMLDQLILSTKTGFVRPLQCQTEMLTFWVSIEENKKLQKGLQNLQTLVTPHRFSESWKDHSGTHEYVFKSILKEMIDSIAQYGSTYRNLKEIEKKLHEYTERYNEQVLNQTKYSPYFESVQNFFEIFAVESTPDITNRDMRMELQTLRTWPKESEPSLYLWSQGIDIHNILRITDQLLTNIQEMLDANIDPADYNELILALPTSVSPRSDIDSFDPKFWGKMTRENFPKYFFSRPTLEMVLFSEELEAVNTCLAEYTAYIQTQFQAKSFLLLDETILGEFDFGVHARKVGLILEMKVIDILRKIHQMINSNPEYLRIQDNFHSTELQDQHKEIEGTLSKYTNDQINASLDNLFETIFLGNKDLRELVTNLLDKRQKQLVSEINAWNEFIMTYIKNLKNIRMGGKQKKFKPGWQYEFGKHISDRKQFVKTKRMFEMFEDMIPTINLNSHFGQFKSKFRSDMDYYYSFYESQELNTSVETLFVEIRKHFELQAWSKFIKEYTNYLQERRKYMYNSLNDTFKGQIKTLQTKLQDCSIEPAISNRLIQIIWNVNHLMKTNSEGQYYLHYDHRKKLEKYQKQIVKCLSPLENLELYSAVNNLFQEIITGSN